MAQLNSIQDRLSALIASWSVGKKLAVGFGAILFILVALVSFIQYKLSDQEILQNQVIELRVPTTIAGHDLVNGINYSLAALRGYMILGKDSFKKQRKQAWLEIDTHLAVMTKMSANWTVKNNIAQLAELKEVLHRFKLAQQEVENISNSVDEQPAMKILLTEAAPKAQKVVLAITAMIDEEKKQAATAERKALLALLADSRGSFAMGLASIRGYLISGEQKWADDFNHRWSVNSARLTSLQKNSFLFTKKQRQQFKIYLQQRIKFSPLPEKMFTIRGSKQWNMANFLLANKAAPEAGKALSILTQLVENQNSLVEMDVQKLKHESSVIKVIAIVATIIALLLGGFIAWFITKAITAPLEAAIKATEKIASGDLSSDIEINSQDEIGQLLMTMQRMQGKLSSVIEQEVQTIVDAAKVGDLTARINIGDKHGFYGVLSNSINELVAVNEEVINDTKQVLNSMAEGDLTQRINNEYQGAFDQLKQDAHRTADKLIQVIEGDIQGLITAANMGNLSHRIELADKQGFYEMLSRNINELVDINEQVVNDSSRVMAAMAQGNLTKTIDANYQGVFAQLKDDTNNSIKRLTEVIGNIRVASDQVSTGASEIAMGNVDLSKRTEDQAAMLEETSSSMEQISSTVQMSEQNAKDSALLAVNAKQIAEHGGEIVTKAIVSMDSIGTASDKIADIIGVIDAIAFQTNLLALNAAVEAARAGEQGRGFAVVATEVRNLAKRSADAAKEIKGLINDSGQKVAEGTELVNRAGEALTDIVKAVDDVSSAVIDISEATAEQNSGIQQVNIAVNQMDEMTQQNAALVEQASAASESMSGQAKRTLELVNFFHTKQT